MARRFPIVFLFFVCASAVAAWPMPRALNKPRLDAAGLRMIESPRATLVTDAPSSPAIDELPSLIDQAIPQWAEHLGVEPDDAWRLRIYLIEEESRFRSLGLWPNQSAEFPHGLSLGYEVWLRQQASDYYRRHLLLHEATHSLMSTNLGSCGPGWYMEGVAELMGTHVWERQRLRLGVMPASRQSVPGWGRVRLIREAVAAGEPRSIAAVLKTDNRRELPVKSYAWVWALCWFLDNHPEYCDRFAELPSSVEDPQFNQRLRELYASDAAQLAKEWRLFISTLVYGHDLEREAIHGHDGTPLAADSSRQATILADRGWQPTGVALRAGETALIEAAGRFQIGQEPDGTPWPCEPNGITLAWHAGRPCGEVLATIDSGPGAFVDFEPVGLAGEYTAKAAGTLYLRVNDSPNSLADNAGEVSVSISAR